MAVAHCLYVLTDDNYPAISDIRSNAGYPSCLLEIVRLGPGLFNGKGKETLDERFIALSVLASGMYPVAELASLTHDKLHGTQASFVMSRLCFLLRLRPISTLTKT